jgi:hypothetical protein
MKANLQVNILDFIFQNLFSGCERSMRHICKRASTETKGSGKNESSSKSLRFSSRNDLSKNNNVYNIY